MGVIREVEDLSRGLRGVLEQAILQENPKSNPEVRLPLSSEMFPGKDWMVTEALSHPVLMLFLS